MFTISNAFTHTKARLKPNYDNWIFDIILSYYPIILIASKWRIRTRLRRLRIQSRDSHWKYIWESNVAPALIVVWRTKLSVFLSRNPQTLVISISQQRLLFVIISQFGLPAGQASLNFAKCLQIFPKCFLIEITCGSQQVLSKHPGASQIISMCSLTRFSDGSQAIPMKSSSCPCGPSTLFPWWSCSGSSAVPKLPVFQIKGGVVESLC